MRDVDAKRRCRFHDARQNLAVGHFQPALLCEDQLGAAVKADFGAVRRMKLATRVGPGPHARAYSNRSALLERDPTFLARQQRFTGLVGVSCQHEQNPFRVGQQLLHVLAHGQFSASVRHLLSGFGPGAEEQHRNQKPSRRGENHG